MANQTEKQNVEADHVSKMRVLSLLIFDVRIEAEIGGRSAPSQNFRNQILKVDKMPMVSKVLAQALKDVDSQEVQTCECPFKLFLV